MCRRKKYIHNQWSCNQPGCWYFYTLKLWKLGNSCVVKIGDWEIYSNNQKNFAFFHLNPPKIFLSTLAIKQHLRPKYPSLISPKLIQLPSSAATSTLVGGGSISHRHPIYDLQPSTKPRLVIFLIFINLK